MTQNDIRKGVAAIDEQMKTMEYTLANLRSIADDDVYVTQEPGYIIRFTKNGQHSDCNIPKGHYSIPPTLLNGYLDYIKAEHKKEILDKISDYKKLQEERELLDLQNDFV